MPDLAHDPHEIEALRGLKARYFRFIDSKDWDALRELFTDDMTFYRDAEPTPTSTTPVTTSADDFVDRLRTWLATAVTVHHGHMGELHLETETTARGIWAMFDWVDNPRFDRAYQGYGHYHERYQKGDDGAWRIAELRLTRLRIEHLAPTPAETVAEGRLAWLDRRL